MGVVHLKRPLPLGVVIIYCPYKDEESTSFDIKPQRHHINKKNDIIHCKKIQKERKWKIERWM
jgi:hypothetical protein